MFRDDIPSGKRVRQARELNGMTQSELADRLGVSQGLIAQIEGSFKLASPELIQKIAVQTKRFDPSFFYREPLVEFLPESVMFRAMSRMTRNEETEARRYAEVVCEMAGLLLRYIKPMEFKLRSALSTDVVDAARRVRNLLGLSEEQPLPHLLREIEKSGVLALTLPISLPKRDALSLWGEHLNMPVIALSAGYPGDRMRLSAAHELGHIVLKHSRVLGAGEEQQAYQFAAELLMPETAMRREITQPVTISSLANLKSRWRVSIQALIRRAGELGIITEQRAKYLYIQLSSTGSRKNEPVQIPIERPRLLRQLVERVYGTDIQRLANELGYRSDFVREILNSYEARQPEEDPLSTKVVSFRTR